MKQFVLMLAAMAVLGGQRVAAQTSVKTLSAEAVTLDVSQVANSEQTVRLGRYFFAGYNTLCLPMSLSASQLAQTAPGAKIERLAAIGQEGSTLCLYFVDCTSEGVEAGMPYLIFTPNARYLQVSTADAARTTTDATTVRMADNAGNQLSFGSSWTARTKEGLYGIPAKQDVKVLESILVRTSGDQRFLPTRCGFNWESQSPTATSLEIRHIGSLSEVTAVASVASGDAAVDVYDLKGNLLLKQVSAAQAKGQLPAGVYVIGGQKVTVK